jgi:hypothetical protein
MEQHYDVAGCNEEAEGLTPALGAIRQICLAERPLGSLECLVLEFNRWHGTKWCNTTLQSAVGSIYHAISQFFLYG